MTLNKPNPDNQDTCLQKTVFRQKNVRIYSEDTKRHLAPNNRGVTLIELITVVVLIAILVTIGIATYNSFLKKARSVEAIEMLNFAADHERSYHAEYGKYTDDKSALGFSVKGSKRFYTLTISVPAGSSPQSYLATASGVIDGYAGLDEWTIDESRGFTHTVFD